MMSSAAAAAAGLVGNSKDLVGEILSRLPWTSVIRFRLVCKEWFSLANIQHPPFFVVQYSSSTTKKSDHFNALLFNIEDHDNNNMNMKMKSVREYVNLSSNFSLKEGRREKREKEEEEQGKIYYKQRTNTNFFHRKTYYDIKLISSCRGFLLFTAKPAANRFMPARSKEDPALILYNPFTKEKHTVTAPPSTHVYCGFYYHSPTKEHRILYQLMFYSDHHEYEAKVVQFLVFGLQTKSTRVLKLKVNNNTSLWDAAYYYNHPDTSTPPVISNGSLHWFVSEDDPHRVENPTCSRSILSFGIENEEFHTMPHPPLFHTCPIILTPRGRRYRHRMNLLEMEEGVLCLCDGYYRSKKLEIYVMEDYDKWIWIKRYSINLSHYIYDYNRCVYGLHYKALQILQGDQLLLEYHPERWFMWWKYPSPGERHVIYHEYALYSLNEQPVSSSIGIGMMRKNNNKRQPFQVMIDGYPNHGVIGKLMRMIIKPYKKWRAPSVGGNMVVLTPSLTSVGGNGSAPGISTFFSIRTNCSYEYIEKLRSSTN